MVDAERYWAVASGVAGLVCLVSGTFLTALPPVDRPMDEVVAAVARRRSAVLTGAVLTAAAGALLVWPIAAVVTFDDATWPSLRLFSVGLAVLGAAGFAGVGLCIATAAWRIPSETAGARALLDLAHLGTWSVSAPIGALLVVATTAAGVQADLFGPLVVTAAAAKVTTVAVELAGTARMHGWNAGGWAAGVSGYVTVAWYAMVLAALV